MPPHPDLAAPAERARPPRLRDIPGYARMWTAATVSVFGTYVTGLALQVIVVVTLHASATGVGVLVSFVVAYASIAWLLRYVAHHSIVVFVWYRLIAGAVIILVLATGVVSAT